MTKILGFTPLFPFKNRVPLFCKCCHELVIEKIQLDVHFLQAGDLAAAGKAYSTASGRV